MGLSSHQSARMKNDEWLTPPDILERLGEFDLDPCSPINRPWDTAKKHYTVLDNGLEKEWVGRVWMNPPFGRVAKTWMLKLKQHGNGIALIPARTETEMFYHTVWSGADSILFLKGRPKFYFVDGKQAKFNSGAPICLVAYGSKNTDCLLSSGLGVVLKIKE